MNWATVASLMLIALIFFADSAVEATAYFIAANVWMAADWLNDKRKKG